MERKLKLSKNVAKHDLSHSHDYEDPLSLNLKRPLRIEMKSGSVELGEREMFVASKGVRHNLVADASVI